MRKILAILLLVGLLIAFLPYFGSSEYVTQKIEQQLEKRLGGECKIGRLTLSWTGSQVCRDVRWVDHQKGLVIEASQVAVRAPLFDCMQIRETPLNVEIEGVVLNLQAGMKWIKKTKKDLHIAFSPIDATLCNREITFKRVELDINDKMTAYGWGSLDLKKDSIEMTLGLPQPLLAKVFKECRHLPEDFLLEVPLSCDLSVQSIQKKLFWYLLKNYATVTSLHK